jgi:hypothetical protein
VTDRPAIEVIGAFESTYLPAHDVDVLEVCGHVERRRDDLALLAASHVQRLRYPIRWHRVEAERGRYDWRATDLEFAEVREAGLRPIVDLVHHTSYPRWLAHGFADPRFGAGVPGLRHGRRERYPWIEEYTVFNEPFATLFLCGHEGAWYPFGRDMGTLVELFLNVLPSVLEASRRLRAALPSARHVHVETCEDTAGPTTSAGRRRGSRTIAASSSRISSAACHSAPKGPSCARWRARAGRRCSISSPATSTCSGSTTTPTPSGRTRRPGRSHRRRRRAGWPR